MLIYGWKTYAQVLAVLTLVCKQCAMPAEHVVRRMTTKFTLFFIPLFPVGRKHTLTCSACEAVAKLSREQAEQMAMGGGVGQPAAQAPFTGPPTPPPQAAFGPPPRQAPPMQPPMQPQYGPPAPQYGPPQPQYQRGPAHMPMHQPYQAPPPQPVPNGGYPPPRPQGGYPPPSPPGYPYPPGR